MNPEILGILGTLMLMAVAIYSTRHPSPLDCYLPDDALARLDRELKGTAR